MRRRMSGRGWWMVMMTVTPAEARPDRMSTTLEALLLSKPAAACILVCDTTLAQPLVLSTKISFFLQGLVRDTPE